MSAYTIIFAPIAQATRSEQVVERLENAINSGLLKSNEQLPNEADLARLMGVSPITVREALNTLRVKGLIDTRRGRNGGSFVCELPSDLLLNQHPLRQASNEYLADLGEFHSAILSHSAYLAAQRTTEYELNKIKELIDQFEQAVEADTRAQLDLRCLLTLTSFAQSSRLANQELTIQAEWAPLIAVLYQDDDFHREVVKQYHHLLSSFIDNNENEAVIQARKIVSMLTDQMLRYKLSSE
ncbi:FadR/GntR family transcriptional regulator [Acinetobacter baumannii]|uniref:FadR/GntR family transcriptional regulator n=1 Tax=Acinetobacter baumannii TaxID=470 RepID=UPI002296E7E7|nr:GntR family transcriptional regulator [Acinetobacter baumannii]MDY7437996.1 GntR family transcriptional regulator [Acinetobacter baumannii]HCW4878229.1 GntR family transcriptional regulator [Acinetobacter baumannii]HCW6189081.1 GntR family transcriptional regulator [Acinetobacter baumannii]